MPPSRAMAMAMRDSVTVSIAAATSGMDSSMLRVSRVVTSVSRGAPRSRRARAARRRTSGPRPRTGRPCRPVHAAGPGDAIDTMLRRELLRCAHAVQSWMRKARRPQRMLVHAGPAGASMSAISRVGLSMRKVPVATPACQAAAPPRGLLLEVDASLVIDADPRTRGGHAAQRRGLRDGTQPAARGPAAGRRAPRRPRRGSRVRAGRRPSGEQQVGTGRRHQAAEREAEEVESSTQPSTPRKSGIRSIGVTM
jgi:hypothetical protein